MRPISKIVLCIIFWCCVIAVARGSKLRTRGGRDASDSAQLPVASKAELSPAVAADKTRRDEILAVVNNNLSTETCKNAVMTQVGDGTQCLRDGCATLERLKGFIHAVQCSDADYDKLHAVLCVPSDPPCTSPSPETSPAVGRVTTKAPLINREQAQRNQIRCTMEKQMSSPECSSTVLSQTSEDDDLGAGCAKLESFKTLVFQLGCTQPDYDKLHDVICSWDGTERCLDYVQKQKDAITINENSLSNSCNKSIYDNIRSPNLTAYCANIKNAKDRLLSTKSCDISEIGNLTAIVCCKDAQCFEPGVDPSTRKGKVTLAVRALSTRCRSTMTVAIDDFSQPLKEACKALDATKPNLLNGGVCSEKDYSSLEEVVCKPDDEACSTPGECTTVFDPFASEQQQRDNIKLVISQLNGTCKTFMTDVAKGSVSDPLEKTCKSFLDNHGFIVVGDQCSQGQYDTLKLAICGKGTAGRTEANVVTLIIGAMFVLVKAMYEQWY